MATKLGLTTGATRGWLPGAPPSTAPWLFRCNSANSCCWSCN